jgi:DUF1680 family protein
VREGCGRIALQRGPLVYCLEEADNGRRLDDLYLPRRGKLTAEWRDDLFGGTMVITGSARRRSTADWADSLYRSIHSQRETVAITAVPYCLWANRGEGEMLVWLRGD